MLGRLRTRMLVLSAVVVMSVSFVSQDGSATLALTKHDNCTCESSRNTSQYCKTQTDINWYSWLMGESGSAQFHYLDLLELLLGSGRQSDSSIPQRPGI
ncbi:hypothetical protein PSECIP111951_02726 [Pseudoalteromonas holothuriae]|uniref:Uncharacterized protein n=1 Tax=Pseudoalteromonas holothuriae TaxID=2963714 RepID=A0A9W4W2U5_9GAMM|nr:MULTISPECIES: hypothetical protein [unclassified Pseudoalteromonas]CAH9055065.1 hypothetical protein PSECIP111854_01504 [Pseudoalteromonas sp. CIP111854]CAH9062608.1 hypothetical protein PSECIP111951_02726 [Pseudoalteromonas sp. CIP111951]